MLTQLKVQGVRMVTAKEGQQIQDKAKEEKGENAEVAAISTDPEMVTSTGSQCNNLLDLLFSDSDTGKNHQSV